ncbi:hypothetical protein BDV97DRAFT_424121 [Delphinella strobiligena]|nr:hypothetical protein BDV97DRAFT_424121 [Delphinella strobiligena]
MNDLLGQDWSAPAKKTSQTNPFSKPIPSYSGLQPSPVPLAGNGLSPQPLSRPSSGLNTSTVSSKPNTPANDSFANLLGRNVGKAPGSLTLQERQKQLLEEKRKQETEQNQRWATQFGGGDAWENLGSGRGTPVSGRGSPAVRVGNGALGGSNGKGRAQESEADILAAFNSAAPVDKSSHFPPPASIPPSRRSTPAAAPTPTPPPPASSSNRLYGGPGGNALLGTVDDDDDDPFGLGNLPQQRNLAPSQQTAALDDDDDILGDLAKPVTEKPAQRSTVDDAFDIAYEQRAESPSTAHPLDPAVAELVDMGFPADTSRVALQETGGDIQAAVGFLLNQAHEESRQKSQVGGGSRRGTPSQNGHSDLPRASSQRRGRESDAVPPWMRQESRPTSAQRRTDNASPGTDKDVAQYASEIGTSFLKSANSLWKQGRKQVVKAVADLQAEHDPSQPKWMRDASADSHTRSSSQRRQHSTEPRQHTPQPQPPTLTDEAVLLEAANQRPQKPARTMRRPDFPQELPQERRTLSPAQNLPIRSQSQPQTQPRFTQQAPHVDKRPATKLSRLEVEAQSEQTYISPARRKRPTKPEHEPEVDLFNPAPTQPTVRPTQTQSARASPAPRLSSSQPVRPRPVAPARDIPAISPSALSISSTHRRAGAEAFKRGDYDSAHTSYTAALTPLPSTHPLVIIVLSNRALTAIKTGDPKTAISDADRAIDIIGVSKGEGEKIDLGPGEGEKDMGEFYGKALMRKAEALEHMEKWSDAASAWRLAVEAGVGGAVSLRGRDRCEKAANPRPSKPAVASTAPKPVAAKPAVKPAGRSVAPSRPAISAAQSAEAVRKLREANAAAEKADDEKFALNDKVDATLAAWKGTKSDNLRALLGSLDSVLWPEAGWKKVGMSDLVIPGKVKIIYMKAIAKVHPDKISQTATTEQRMISGAVFSTLNEAWDKFKKDNNL